ncbi:Pectate lyase superfamily protein [Planctomycetes bacterium CA13]|uniref:Pectate lyase superfamily protein n=1 Tax=Novipirellula herctigrandis TaxID=2527986 RepID=A0A5C5Z6F8_9BACT|nr:Pectate lyase superfamily protein [Planctomycetes bacterium CA13]
MCSWLGRWTLLVLLLVCSMHSVAFGNDKDRKPVHSQLWGQTGEQWTPTSRLPDFSYAGYHRGERPLPNTKADVSVKEFGAVGDGKSDDSEAFQKAIDASGGKTIAVPPGAYVITKMLSVKQSSTVLQGAGPDRSILRFVTPLNDIKPNWGATTTGRRTSNYSWSGGFIAVSGSFPRKKLAEVTKATKRGDTSLIVSSVKQLNVGDSLRLTLSETHDQSLAKYLYSNDSGKIDKLGNRASVTFVARVTAIEKELNKITLDRPLRTDIQLRWKPTIYSARSSVEEAGIEGLGFEFPPIPYEGHFTELGFNAIALSGTRNCWLRNLRILNADSGIFLHGINTTAENIVFESQRKVEPKRKATGHHGVTLGGQDNLLTSFDFRTRFMHDITVTRGSAGNVAASGRGIDLCFDHHCHAPHANLFTSIDLGKGSRMFQSGGGAALGRHAASWTTFWGIQSAKLQSWPKDWGPDQMNMVGVKSTEPASVGQGRWIEPINPQELTPMNLYQAQLERRLAKESK